MSSLYDGTPFEPAKLVNGDWIAPTRGFGIEFECVWPSEHGSRGSDAFVSKLEAAGFPHHKDFQHTAPPKGWYWGGDNYGHDVWYGGEICTPILYGEEGYAYVRRLTTFLREELGARVTPSCGMHVHVGNGGLTREQKARVVSAFIRYERFFDALASRTRAAHRWPFYITANEFAVHGRSVLYRTVRGAAPGLPQRRTTRATRDEDARAVLRTCVEIGYCGSGGYKIADRGNTFEFRHHQGSVHPDHAEHWARLVTAFVDVAKDKPVAPPRRTLMEPDDKITVKTFEAFLRLWKLPKATRAYLSERRIALLAAAPWGDEDWTYTPSDDEKDGFGRDVKWARPTVEQARAMLERA